MCYIIHALTGERSGLSGKFATGGFCWLGALEKGKPDMDRMASLPLMAGDLYLMRDGAKRAPVFLRLHESLRSYSRLDPHEHTWSDTGGLIRHGDSPMSEEGLK